MAEEGYTSRLCKCNDFSMNGLFGRHNQMVNRLELDHGKTGNQSKVADVQSCNSIAKMQRRSANQQIFEGDAYAKGCLLALYPPSELSDFECNWMDRHVTTQFLGKSSSAITVNIALGSVDAVSQFYDGHR
jgi:hypothetical protein